MEETGVYCIRNILNDKRYVGSTSVSLRTRFKRHRNDLSNGEHHSQALQRAWDLYGLNAFEFTILERCSASNCLLLEQKWIDHYCSANSEFGYNVLPKAGSALGRKLSDKTKKKLSIANLGKVHTEETKRKISNSLKGTKHTAQSILKAAKASAEKRKGKHLSDETKNKISCVLKGKGKSHYGKPWSHARWLAHFGITNEQQLSLFN